jgi:hypothetical protein
MVRSRIKDILRNEEPAWLVLLIIAALMPLQYRYIPPFMILLFVLKITERILHGTTVPPVESRLPVCFTLTINAWLCQT